MLKRIRKLIVTLLLLPLLGLLAIVLWWWLSKRKQIQEAEEREPITLETVHEEPTPDDLTRIEGIGPKISSVLQEKGMLTFSQLANSDVEQLNQILDQAGIRIADPTTWPEQATLAAAEDWEALEDLQDQLVGGRRV